MRKKNIAIILFLSLLLGVFFMPQEAKAWPSVATTGAGAGAGFFGDAGIFGGLFSDLSKETSATIQKIAIGAAKVAALFSVQAITRAIIGDGGGGGTISNWNNYLFISPQQRAMEQMNTFFINTSKGRLSFLNYEGVGPNYDAYLVAQARAAISGQSFVTNIQEQVTNPSTQMFSGGNMKGIMSYMQCANNVACYTLTATERYSTEFAKAQEIAKNEQLNGFLPVKKNGIITQPAAIAQNALLQIDQLGTQLIMNAAPADGAGAYAQIAGGATMSIAARTLNYSISNEQGKAAIASKNDEFPFSIGYSNIGGLNFSAGGVKVNTGAAAFNAQTMLGNTCSSAGLVVDGSGAAGVAVQGRKGTCIPASNSSVQGPSASAKAPSATIDGSTAGGQTVSAQ